MRFTDRRVYALRCYTIMDRHTEHMAGVKMCLNAYRDGPLQSLFIGIHYHSLVLDGACFEKVITEN